MITMLFVTGGLAFYLFLLVASALFFTCEEHDDSPGGTVLALMAFFACWLLLGDMGPVVLTHPWRAVLAALAWVAAGMLWSFPRWILFLRRVLCEYKKAHAEYLAGSTSEYVNDRSVRKPNTEAGWVKNGSYAFLFEYGMSWQDGKIQPPAFAPNRKRLVAWVLLWPWSLLWTFCREVVLQGAQHLVNLFGGTYARLAAWIFQGAN